MLNTHAHLWPIARKTLFPLPAYTPRRVTPSVFAQAALEQQQAVRKQTRGPSSEPVETWRQMALKNVPPAPKRREKRLGVGVLAARTWVGERWAEGAWAGHEAKALAKVLRKMALDSVIYAGEWRLELVAVERGYPHYRLLFGSRVFGVADIPIDWRTEQAIEACPDLPNIQADLARYLVGCGFTAEMAARTLTPGAAKTPYKASKRALHHLLKIDQGFDRGHEAITLLCDLVASFEGPSDTGERVALYAGLFLSLLSTVETECVQTLAERQMDAVLCATVVNMILYTDILIARQMTLF